MKCPVDLHIHSKYSDGTDDVEKLLNFIHESNIKVFSVTDHDTIEFYNNIDSVDLKGIDLITGIEFSCITNIGKCHILGYGFDLKDPTLLKLLSKTQEMRKEKLVNRLAYLEEEHKIQFSADEHEFLLAQTAAGKPHIAQLLIKKGLANTINEAIGKYLSKLPKGGETRIDAKLAIETINLAGGIPIWAHPLGGENEKRLSNSEFEQQLSHLISLGIKGLECFYSRYDEQTINFLTSQTANNNLLISGGSDYHGTTKDIYLGELCSTPSMFINIAEKLSVLNFYKK